MSIDSACRCVFSHYTDPTPVTYAAFMTSASPAPSIDPAALLADLRRWSEELGFSRLGIANIDLAADEAHFLDWLRAGFNGDMAYMSRHGVKRSRPAELLPGTVSCISVRMDYWPRDAADAEATLADPQVAYVSRYALGRDYHKLLRARLQRLCDRIAAAVGPFGYRVFTDSAPVLEKALARNAGLGWIGKHTNLIDRDAGSYFFLGGYTLISICRLTYPPRRIAAPVLRVYRPVPPAPSSGPIASTHAAYFLPDHRTGRTDSTRVSPGHR